MYTQTSKTASAPLLGLAFCFSLCACSTTSETFDCPSGKGVGCKSISEVNHIVNQGGLGDGEVERGVQFITPLFTPVISTDSAGVDTLSKPPAISLSDTMAVQRIQEEHLRVWIAPYQDAQGNLHEGSIVHTVLKPGSWQIRADDPRAVDPRASNASMNDASIGDTSLNDTSIDDANIDDSRAAHPHPSHSEEYP